MFYRDDRRRVHLVTMEEVEARFERALFHEAGHATVGIALGCRVTRVLVNADDAVTTSHHRRRRGPPHEPWENVPSVACHLGGYFAERRRFPHLRSWALRCASTDLRRAHRLARRGTPAWREGVRLSYRTLVRHWVMVEAIARHVAEAGRADERELLFIASRSGLVPAL
jgi:hypothetical protein